MVKDEKWSKEGKIFETQGFRVKKDRQSGERFWDLEDLPSIIERFVEKTTYKRWQQAYEDIREYVRKVSNLLFLMINRDAIGSLYNPYGYEVSETTGEYYSKVQVWQALSRSYALKKGPNKDKFWLYRGNLRDWLASTLPSQVFGTPEVYADFNKQARGYQDMHITIRPFPKAGHPNVPRGDDINIYNELFGRHAWGGGYYSNEDVRPIMAPAMRKLVDTRLKNGVKRILKEVWSK